MKHNVIVNSDHLLLMIQLPCVATRLTGEEILALRADFTLHAEELDRLIPPRARPAPKEQVENE